MTHTVSHTRPLAGDVVVSRSTPFNRLPEWLSVAELGAFLGLSKSSAFSTIHGLPKRKFGRHYRVHKSHFQPTRGRK